MGKFKRRSQARWDARNLQTVSTHVTREEAAQFRKACSMVGATPYSVLRRFILACLNGTVALSNVQKVHNS